jgi:hypothetical protein
MSLWSLFSNAAEEIALDPLKQLSESLLIEVGTSSMNPDKEERQVYQLSCDIPRLGYQNYQQLFEYRKLTQSYAPQAGRNLSKAIHHCNICTRNSILPVPWILSAYAKISRP